MIEKCIQTSGAPTYLLKRREQEFTENAQNCPVLPYMYINTFHYDSTHTCTVVACRVVKIPSKYLGKSRILQV